jgi:uroporphyrinogen-III decarboxylase
MALSGGIDTQLLLTGKPEAVRLETRRVMEVLKPSGGYVCTPDQYFPYMPEENILAMWDAAAEWGVY